MLILVIEISTLQCNIRVSKRLRERAYLLVLRVVENLYDGFVKSVFFIVNFRKTVTKKITMKTLKNYVKMLTIATILAAGPGVRGQEVTEADWIAAYAGSEIPKLDARVGPEFKVSTKLAMFRMYGAVGFDAMPLKKQKVYDPTKVGREGKKQIITRPDLAGTLTAGAEIGKQNKFKLEFQKSINTWDKTTTFSQNKYNAGYLREQQISENQKFNFYAGLSYIDEEYETNKKSIENSHLSDGFAFETKIGYQRRIADWLNLFANVGYSHTTEKHHRGNIETRPLPTLSANVGLHLDLRPESPFNPRQRSPKVRAAKPQKRKVSNTVPCYAYPQQRGKESKIFNRPNEMR